MEDFPHLRKIGIKSIEDISQTLLSISERLRTQHLTHGLILELSDIVQILEKGKSCVSSDKITKIQLCEFILVKIGVFFIFGTLEKLYWQLS